MNRRAPSATAVAVLLALSVAPAVHVTTAAPAAAQTGVAPADAPDDALARVTLAAIDPVVGRGSIPAAPVVEDSDLPPGAAPEAPANGSEPASATGVGWSILIEHTGPDAWTRIEVLADLHGALGSRSALRAALSGGIVPPSVQRVSVPAASGPFVPGDVVRVDGVVPLVGGALTGTDSAVHPLRLRVLVDGQIVGGIDTAVVRLGAAPTATLTTSLVWPLSSPPLRDPAGDPAAALDPTTLAGGRLDTLLRALRPLTGADGNGAPAPSFARGVALLAPAHLLEDLARRSSGVPAELVDDAVRSTPAPRPTGEPEAEAETEAEAVDEAALRAAVLLQRIRDTALALPADPVVSPYADADLSGLLTSGPALQPIAARAMLEGERRLAALLGRTPGPSVLLDAPVVPGTLDLLPDATALLPYAAIDAPDLALDVPLADPVRVLRSPTGRPLTALVADPYLSTALGASTRELPADPLLAAHEVLVRTAMVHLEAPGRQGRGLLLMPPPGFDPDPRFAAEVLARLARAPWLTPSTPNGVVAAAQGAREPARLASGGAEPLPRRLIDALASTARDLELLIGAADRSSEPAPGSTAAEQAGDTVSPRADGETTGPLIPVGDRTLAEAGDELMRATSTAFASDLDTSLALLEGVRAGVDRAFGTVSIAMVDVTLTDRDGTIPLTLTHAGGVPLRVRVEVSAPAALTWTDGQVREVTLGVDAERSLEIPVRSGATGRFPVSIEVTDPSGQRVLAADTVGVRATAVAGPALALIILTVVALTVYGTARQRRRGLAWQTHGAPDGQEVTR